MEPLFAAGRDASDLAKYRAASSLPTATAREIRDLLFTPPAKDTYKTLKETLICQELRWLRQLLRGEEPGDRKLS